MMRKLFSILAACALASVSYAGSDHDHAGAADAKKRPELKKMTVDEVAAKLARNEVQVFDNNSAERYAQGHIPGAKWVKYDAVEAKDLPADKAASLVFYCANERCSACHKAAYTAIDLGYTNVFIMPAGIVGWEKAEKATEKAAQQNPS